MRYRVFTRTPTGQYLYETTSSALGSGPPELQLIRESHGMVPGDVIYIGDFYVELLDEGEPPYCYMSLMDLTEAQRRQMYQQAVSAESSAA